MSHLGINVVFDIGANRGQFATELLENGFTGQVISFEPTQKAYEELVKSAERHQNWHVHPRVAVGEKDATVSINVAGNSAASSSILDMGDLHKTSAPESQYVGVEEVKLTTLAAVFHQYAGNDDKVFLKIDVQGYEENVLSGALPIISKVGVIKLECSLVSLYEGDKVYQFYFDWLQSLGFVLWDLEPGYRHRETGRLLQFDATFVSQSLNDLHSV
ncbi:MAG: FkbM family methyltransferase [Pseudomonadota bacterium]